MTKVLKTESELTEQGMKQLTNGYILPEEAWMMQGVINDLEIAGVESALAETPEGRIAVWCEETINTKRRMMREYKTKTKVERIKK